VLRGHGFHEGEKFRAEIPLGVKEERLADDPDPPVLDQGDGAGAALVDREDATGLPGDRDPIEPVSLGEPPRDRDRERFRTAQHCGESVAIGREVVGGMRRSAGQEGSLTLQEYFGLPPCGRDARRRLVVRATLRRQQRNHEHDGHGNQRREDESHDDAEAERHRSEYRFALKNFSLCDAFGIGPGPRIALRR